MGLDLVEINIILYYNDNEMRSTRCSKVVVLSSCIFCRQWEGRRLQFWYRICSKLHDLDTGSPLQTTKMSAYF